MKLKFVVLAVLSLTLGACSVLTVKEYNPNFKTTRELEKSNQSFSSIEIITSKSDVEKVLGGSTWSCRLAKFDMPHNKTVKKYIEKALTDELEAARKLSSNKQKLVVTINDIVSDSSGIGTGTWTLDFNYSYESKSIPVKTTTPFNSAFTGTAACRNTAMAFEDAIRDNFSNFVQKLSVQN